MSLEPLRRPFSRGDVTIVVVGCVVIGVGLAILLWGLAPEMGAVGGYGGY